jgi:hypothetical protein
MEDSRVEQLIETNKGLAAFLKIQLEVIQTLSDRLDGVQTLVEEDADLQTRFRAARARRILLSSTQATPVQLYSISLPWLQTNRAILEHIEATGIL